MPSRIQILQRGVLRRHFRGAALAGLGVNDTQVNALGLCNGHQLLPEPLLDRCHMRAVLIAAHTDAQNGLGQVIADIQPELSPHLLPDMLLHSPVQPGSLEKRLHCLHPLTVIGSLRLAEEDAHRGVRRKADAAVLPLGGHLDEGIQDMRPVDSFCNDLLTVHAVHETHHDGIFSHDGRNVVQGAPQVSVLQRHDQKIRILRLLRRPDRRPVDFTVDAAAPGLQPGIPLPGGHHAERYAFLPGKPPDHIRAYRTRAEQRHLFDFHNLSSS